METRDISITVTDGSNPISGASASVGDISSTTGSAGGCTLHEVPDGARVITVSADGYVTRNENVVVSVDNTSFNIVLEAESSIQTTNVTFTITDRYDDSPVKNAPVSVKYVDFDVSEGDVEYTGTTNNDGVVIINNIRCDDRNQYFVTVGEFAAEDCEVTCQTTEITIAVGSD